MTSKKRVTLNRIRKARSLLLDVMEWYTEDLSSRDKRAVSDTRSLLADIQDDLEERGETQ